MRKRLLSIWIACMMLLAFRVSVYADPSIVGSIDMPRVDSSEGEVTLNPVGPNSFSEEMQQVIDIFNNANPNLTLKELYDLAGISGEGIPTVNDESSKVILDETDLSKFKMLSPFMDLNFNGTVPTKDHPVTVTFTVNNLTDNIDVYVLSYCPEHGWELLTTKVVNGNQVICNFHSGATPMALVYRKKAEDGQNGQNGQNGQQPNGGGSGGDNGTLPVKSDNISVASTSSMKSPKTGEDSASWMMLTAGVTMVILSGYAVYRGRKSVK